MKKNIVVYIAALLDVISIGIFIPAMADLVSYYSVSERAIGISMAAYSLASFVATPVLGQLSDKYGRKVLLSICVLGTALSYLILLLSPHYRLFILSRVLNGRTGGNISIIQSILADLSPDHISRQKKFATIGAIFGMGFIIGPVLGSILLGLGGVIYVFRGGAILAILDLIFLYIYLPETNQHRHLHIDKTIDRLSYRTIKKYLFDSNISKYLQSFVLLGIGGFTYQSLMSIYVSQTYGIGGNQFGYILGILGVISAINMGYIYPRFWSKKLTPHSIIKVAHITTLIVLCLLYLHTKYLWGGEYAIYVFMFIFMRSVVGMLYSISYQTEILKHSDQTIAGEISGVIGGLNNVGMILGPIVGSFLLGHDISIYLGAMFFITLSAILIFPYISHHKYDKSNH